MESDICGMFVSWMYQCVCWLVPDESMLIFVDDDFFGFVDIDLSDFIHLFLQHFVSFFVSQDFVISFYDISHLQSIVLFWFFTIYFDTSFSDPRKYISQTDLWSMLKMFSQKSIKSLVGRVVVYSDFFHLPNIYA